MKHTGKIGLIVTVLPNKGPIRKSIAGDDRGAALRVPVWDLCGWAGTLMRLPFFKKSVALRQRFLNVRGGGAAISRINREFSMKGAVGTDLFRLQSRTGRESSLRRLFAFFFFFCDAACSAMPVFVCVCVGCLGRVCLQPHLRHHVICTSEDEN